jgi:hypothetical protein
MSGMEIYVKDEEEKAQLIEDYLAPDNKYLKALDTLKQDLINRGVDLETKEGRKLFILEVRKLNSVFGQEP